MDMKTSSTIGYERHANPTLQITDEQQFVDQALASLVVRHGGRDVVHVTDGGVPKWGRLGHELEKPDAPTEAV
jgi:hypothetical protein